MKFAHFSHIWAKPGMTPHQRYEELWHELQLCEELGFDYGFCVEHHFRPDESWMSSPSLYAVGAGARTRRLRVGPMGYIVPLDTREFGNDDPLPQARFVGGDRGTAREIAPAKGSDGWAGELLHTSGCEQSQQDGPLFDHLFGDDEQRWRDDEAECLGSCQV